MQEIQRVMILENGRLRCEVECLGGDFALKRSAWVEIVGNGRIVNVESSKASDLKRLRYNPFSSTVSNSIIITGLERCSSDFWVEIKLLIYLQMRLNPRTEKLRLLQMMV